MNLSTNQPWDMAGKDGLRVAKALFGEAVDRLAPFQSMETELDGVPCSVLRLCDRNFRIIYPGTLDQKVAAIQAEKQAELWVKQLSWMGAIALPFEQAELLIQQATTRPPHRHTNLPCHCAVPVQIQQIPALLWHHPIQEKPSLEVHLAINHLKQIATYSSFF